MKPTICYKVALILALLLASGRANGQSWNLTGNAGTDPSTHFLGTTDNRPLIIKTNNNEAIRVGTNGNVGIGISNPLSPLSVAGHISLIPNTSGQLLVGRFSSTFPYAYIIARSGTATEATGMIFRTADDAGGEWNRMTISSDGIIYFTPKNLHTTHPSLSGSQFAIAWNHTGGRGETVFYQHGGGGWRSGYDFWSERDGKPKTLLARIQDNGDLKLLGSVGSLSDAREKTNIQPISNALKKLMGLRGVYFNWKDKNLHDGGTHIGLIAQEVLEVVPEVVMGGASEGGEEEMYSLQYSRLTPLLIEALKEQQQIIDNLKDRLLKMEARINTANPIE